MRPESIILGHRKQNRLSIKSVVYIKIRKRQLVRSIFFFFWIILIIETKKVFYSTKNYKKKIDFWNGHRLLRQAIRYCL